MSNSPQKRPYTPYGAARKLWGCRDEEILIEGPAGTGKAQPLSSIVMCPSGPRRMGSIKVGDLVCCPDGTARKVKAIFPQGHQDVYELTFSGGEVAKATSDHIWKVSRYHGEKLSWEEQTTSQMIENMATSRRPEGMFQVPMTSAVEFNHVPVQIDPYVMGVLIGDGCTISGPNFTSADLEIVERVQARVGADYIVRKWPSSQYAYSICSTHGQRGKSRDGKRGYVTRTASGKWMSRVRVPGGSQKYIGSFAWRQDAEQAIGSHGEPTHSKDELTPVPSMIRSLDEYGVLGKRSYEKTIPRDYMVNTSSVRWELVRGLMDTDGTVDRTRGAPTYCTSSPRLAKQFQWLIESFGGVCTISRKKTKCRDAYICFIRLNDPQRLFSLPRKKALCFRIKRVTRYVRSIKKIGREVCQCISVDSPDGLYLTDRFVVTHNSRSVLEKIYFAMMKYPGARALITRKTRESMTESVLVTLEEKVIPPKSPVLEGPGRKLRGSYTFPNGSEIVVGGMDKSAKVMSTEYDIIGCFESTELTEDDHESLTTRLRNGVMPYQQIISDCNPGPPSHWLNKRANAGRMTRLLSRHKDNPVLFEMKLGEFTDKGKKYLGKLDRLTGVRRIRLLEGKWQASEGAVYSNWDEAIHVIDVMPKGWEHYRKVRAIDFGYKNPFVCLWGAIDGDGDIYIYREMYFSHRIVKDHASGVWDETDTGKKLIHRGIVQWSEGESIEATVADHDAEDRATLDGEGVDSVPAHKDILPGIEAVFDRLRPQLHGDGTIRPRLYFMRDCLVERDDDLIENNFPFNTLQEFDGYVWAKLKDNTSKNAKEEPVDKDNHGMDTLRYLVAYVDDLSGQQLTVMAEEPSAVEGSWNG